MSVTIAAPNARRQMRIQPLSKQKQLADCFSFDGFLLQEPVAVGNKGGKRARIMPIHVHDVPAGPVIKAAPAGVDEDDTNVPDDALVNMPLYEHVTADRQVLRCNVAAKRVKNGDVWSSHYTCIADAKIVANGVPMSVTCFDGAPDKELAFVRVTNCFVSLGKDGNAYFNCKAIENAPFEAVNVLSPYERVKLAFGQRTALPAIERLLTTSSPDWSLVPLPLGLVTVDRDTTVPMDYAKDYQAVPRVFGNDAAAANVFVVSQPEIRLSPEDKEKKRPDSVSLRLQLAIEQGERNYRLNELTLFETDLLGAGTAHPRTLRALLENHPIPLQLVVEVDPVETAHDTQNGGRPGSMVEADGIDAYVTVRVRNAAFALREYLERFGIPITNQSLLARYGSDVSVSPYVPADLVEVCAPRAIGNKGYVRPQLVNPYATLGEPSGVVALDYYMTNMRIPWKDYKLFALPLAPMADYDRAKASTMTPAEGDCFLLAHMRPESAITKVERAELGDMADHAPWLQPSTDRELAKKRVPLFLFYAVKAVQPRASAIETAMVQHPAIKPDANDTRPVDAEALRFKLIQEARALPPPPPAKTTDVEAAPGSLKREREEDVEKQQEGMDAEDDGERPTKRVRSEDDESRSDA